MEMLAEACAMIICEDLTSGRDPLDRRAPQEYWDEMYGIIRQAGRPVDDMARVDEGRVEAVAGQVTFVAMRETDGRSHGQPQVPLAWMQPTALQTCSQ
jgi:hypothetical protein